jgi:hypothetical protein
MVDEWVSVMLPMIENLIVSKDFKIIHCVSIVPGAHVAFHPGSNV